MIPALLLVPLALNAGAATLPPLELPRLEVELPTRPLADASELATAGDVRVVPTPRAGSIALTVVGRPGDRVLIAASAATATTAPIGAHDRFWLVNGLEDATARFDADGLFVVEHYVPDALATGLDLSLQAVAFDPRLGATAISTTLVLRIESRLGFDFTRSTGGWTAMGRGANHRGGWNVEPKGAIGHAIGGLEPNEAYDLHIDVDAKGRSSVAAGPSAAALLDDPTVWSPTSVRVLRLETDVHGRGWVLIRPTADDRLRVDGVQVVVSRGSTER